MFIRNPHGSEAIQALASQLDVTFGESLETLRAGFIGNTWAIKDQLKAAGARWDGLNKAWTFDGWKQAEAALLAIASTNWSAT